VAWRWPGARWLGPSTAAGPGRAPWRRFVPRRVDPTSQAILAELAALGLAEPDAPVAEDETAASGHIVSVVYLGPDTRYIVELDAGARLVVTQQNLATTSSEALAQQGKAVRLIWKRQHELPVADGVTGTLEEEKGT